VHGLEDLEGVHLAVAQGVLGLLGELLGLARQGLQLLLDLLAHVAHVLQLLDQLLNLEAGKNRGGSSAQSAVGR
jgi:hypothetical protein